MTDSKTEFYRNVREDVRQLWGALSRLESHQKRCTALDYGTSLPNGEGVNLGITKADIIAALFDTTNRIRASLTDGHDTNLAKLL